MNRLVFSILLVAVFLAAAQSTPPPLSRPSRQEDALRLIEQGQFAGARQVIEGLIAEATSGSTRGYEAALWWILGMAENRLGRYEEAKAALNQALQLCDGSEAAAPELTISILVELGDANLNEGRLGDANRILRRAMAIASQNLPSDHPRLASVQHSFAVLFWMQGNLFRAEKAFRQALTILENSLGPEHADVAVTASGLAGLFTMTRRQAEAIPLLERSKAIFERIYGSEHPDTISATFALGTALIASAPANAELMLREAIVRWRVSQPDRHPHMIKFLGALATSRYAQGDYREAGILSGQALQMSKDVFGPEHPHAIAQMYQHAQLLKDSRRRKEAAALKREADRIRALKGYAESDRHRIDILALR